jgi:cholesterol transport system auxiliary component
MMPRYFSPDESRGRAQTAASATAEHEGETHAELRLGRVTAASYLGERIVFRDSNYELGYYEERRWTERPEAFLRRAVARALFEDRGLRRVVSGAATTLDIELTELTELRSPPVVRVRPPTSCSMSDWFGARRRSPSSGRYRAPRRRLSARR